MDQTPPPPGDCSDRLLTYAQALIGWRIGEIAARLAAGSFKALHWTLRRLITPAEALMRRALRLLADELPAPKPSSFAPTRRAPPPRPAIRAASANPSRPVFRLTEARPGPRTNWLPVNQRPSISIACFAPPPPPAPRAPVVEAAFADPIWLARRLLRQRMKRPSPRTTLSYFRPPGFKARPLGPDGTEVFKALDDMAMRLELALPGSSSPCRRGKAAPKTLSPQTDPASGSHLPAPAR
ncbi:hypothetical protein [Hyphomonas sp.]|uniref:hypothetical protein n=1 Tax=Hyphomonas sp. TaxID=87 RepID=UPI0025B8FF8D|nr:hypothetical protein [Hyphomonas sp.]MBI1400795.1 hypothetical protein [Hyphomonas sp.]